MKIFHSAKKREMKKTLSIFLVFSMLFSLIQIALTQGVKAAAAPYLLSLNRSTYASSNNGGNTSDKSVDGDTNSRWESEWGKDDQWLYVDLGAEASITEVKINWENAYAKDYKIEVSNDEFNWEPIYTKTAGTGGKEDISVNGKGRYVRLHFSKRSQAAYGYSIYEFEVYGTGGINKPPAPSLGPNIALNKGVTASSVHKDWYIKDGQTDAKNAVDGDLNTRWGSSTNESQWIYVDLGVPHTIGRVILDWDSSARSYDIEVSNDSKTWTKVYRQLNGRGGEENIPLYATARYVKMSGITRNTTYEFGLKEFKVYDYVNGDPKPTYKIPDLPKETVTNEGKGSYVTNPNIFPQPAEPYGKTSDVDSPIPSNDWWQSILIKNLGDSLITLPLKSKYQKQGLGILTPSAGWVNGKSVETEKNIDFYLMANNIDTAAMNSKISGYGDYSANVVLSDDDTAKMKTTFVKGSPYIFNEFSDPNSAEIYSTAITKVFDDNNNELLVKDGDTVTADHIGIETTNSNGAPTPSNIKRYYGIFAPEGTVFKKVGAKIKMQLGNGENYVSVATMPSASNLNYFYKHAYAFVTDTKASYSFDGTSSKVTTTFDVKTTLKRTDLESTTLMCLQPVQWKVSPDELTDITYPSVRGTLKVHEGNTFSTVDRFNGVVPQFVEPTNPEYSRDTLLKYLADLDKDTTNNYMSGDAYWQGKALHPLAMGVLIADQINATEYKEKFLGIIKKILTDWYTYTPGDTDNYYFAYNPEWGTLIYKSSEFGANTGLTDHHFTYGYFTFASAVLATYDKDFLTNYGPMVDNLIRDYANPSRTDSSYPMFRNFDPYEGHSWAGGYADNNDGNNQEAAGESLFGWVGEYLWGQVSGNTAYRDAGIYGFTTELRAVKQYWFNMDGDNWVQDYDHKTVGQVYGSANFYGTYFNGNSVYVYGIHWLPTAEYLTSYGFDKDKAAALYEGMKKDIINDYNTNTDPNKGAAPDPNDPETDWRHITWPIESLSDPKAVLDKWDASKVQNNEAFNSYWFVNSMATLGQRTADVWAEDGASATIYKNGSNYTALVWNPSDNPITVTFRNESGVIGYTTVSAKGLVSVDPFIKGSISKSKLKAEIKQADTLKQSDYTANTWSSFAKTLTDAKAVNDDASATLEQVDSALNTLLSATDGLVKLSEENGVNLALNKPAVSSSNEAIGLGAQNITDENAGTRWSSNWVVNKDYHPEFVFIDLGKNYNIGNVKVLWDDAYAKNYQIQVALANPSDESSWTTVKTVTDGAGKLADLNFDTAAARYVRVYCREGATQFGYSIKDVMVYGGSSSNSGSGSDTSTDKSSLASKITEAKNLKQSDYTSDSWSVFTNALNDAINVNENASATQDQIDAAVRSLTNAMSALVKNTTDIPVDTNSNLALNKLAVTSSNECDGLGAQNTTDPNTDSRWSSNWAANKDNHPEYVYVDLGKNYNVSNVKIQWDTAFARWYEIQVCSSNPNSESSWSTVSTVNIGNGGLADLAFHSVSARYVRVYCKQGATQFGYSLRNIEIYTSKAALTAKIKQASELKQSDYTPESWNALSTELTSAIAVNNDPASTLAQLDTEMINITTALSDLERNIINLGANVAINKYAVSSSDEAIGLGAQNVSDADDGSRWSSNWAANKDNHPEYVYLDLGRSFYLSNIKILWDSAYAKNYEIQVASDDSTKESSWSKVAEIISGSGGFEDIAFQSVTARYVRVYCKQGSTQFGYSIKNIELYMKNTELSALIAEGNGLLSTSYTISTWLPLNKALAAAIKANNDILATQDQIDIAIANLSDAITAVKKYAANPKLDLALNKNAVSSSDESECLTAKNLTDTNINSRWSSNWAANKDKHPEYAYVDLGQAYSISNVQVLWDNAYAKGYEIQVATSNPQNESSWTKVSSITNGTGELGDIKFNATSARYVRIYCKEAAGPYGYSIRKIEVY